jgi:hypothetical protein
LSFVNKKLENGSEMPEKYYKELSDNHKELYRETLLENGIVLLLDTENNSLMNDLVLYNYDKLETKALKYISDFASFGNSYFPAEEVFVKNIDEILQGRIIAKLIEDMEWEIDLPKHIFKLFNPRVRKMIQQNGSETFNIV